MLFVSLKKIMISFLFLQPRDFFNNIFNTKITEVKKNKKTWKTENFIEYFSFCLAFLVVQR